MQNITQYLLGGLGAIGYLYFYTAFRTMYFGLSMQKAAIALLIAIALGILFMAAIERKVSKKSILIIVTIILSLTIVGELFAGLQEWKAVKNYGANCERGVYISRWMPFSSHAIYCSENGSWVGND